ncbi:phosphatase PAP2 family protein [Stenotrophomonas sp. PS02289]|uniref:acid phosphatase n=1 Tax=Stenotrophomonas sp. PS02289 TaxID=2991422 RepID=UPI00249CED01|nr:phosphatase PAP2 family protein [Stenotrophomonas sp. PS02289]
MRTPSRRLAPFSVVLVCSVLSACATGPLESPAAAVPPTAAAPSPVPEIRPGVPAGYLGRALPDSLLLLPPPPGKGSAAFARDQAMHAAARKLQGTPRFALATRDADLGFPHVASTFSCALGIPISQADTPRLYLLLQRSMVDAGLATYAAKEHYQRTRPFVFYKEATCAPGDEAALRKDGSYPSGHTAVSWAWALILTELSPDQTDAILARGRAFGENRLICNAHWQSDILQGRAVGSGAVAKLHANADFLADMKAARAEIDAMRGAGIPASDCEAETAALKPRISGVE